MKKTIKTLLAAAALMSVCQFSFAEVVKNIIHLNKANAEQLETIIGIGESKAKSIIAYREEHGPFKTLADLANVKGISEKTLVKLQEKNPNMQL
ncbi:MAG: hypothetical protein A3F17_04135 [Gammaproteobacteria bacterium RIFCSPHIGHO2_12_FULL_41_15]|nr:MAG: hypothetical protein A3F17_04135 [Gammaproteobacteria bacterium RIFCSPHIGHO2_12_FULL_41_15]